MLVELISPEAARIFRILKVISLPPALLLAEKVKIDAKPGERNFKALGAPFLIGLLAVLIPQELPLVVMVSEIAVPFYYVANPQSLLGHFGDLSLKGLILLSFACEVASYLFALAASKGYFLLLSLSIGFYFFSRFLNAALCSEILASKGYGNVGAVIPSFFSTLGILILLLLKDRKERNSRLFLD